MKNVEQKIIPHLWYDKEAVEAAQFYTTIFPESKITNITRIYDTPSGDCDQVSFELWGQKFMAISAGPYFKFNPSISFMVNFDPSRDRKAYEKINEIWNKLSEDGTVLMPLKKYPFSDMYGWIQDKFGLSWQLIINKRDGDERPTILPSLEFVGERYGKAEEAIQFYVSVFEQSKVGEIVHHSKGMAPNREGTIMFSDFMLDHLWFVAMEDAGEHSFDFNEAISFMVFCETQEEIDHYWNQLSAVPESEQCGWLKDKFGISWQIIPREIGEVMENSPPEVMNRMNQAMLKMKKLNLEELRKVYRRL